MALALDVVISPPCMSVAPLDLAPDWPLVAPVPAAIKVVDLVVGASVLVREPVLVGESVLVGAPVLVTPSPVLASVVVASVVVASVVVASVVVASVVVASVVDKIAKIRHSTNFASMVDLLPV